jgi:hypothetical protein
MRALGVTVAFLAVPALAAPAWADETLQPSGSITYTWQGDPALGCAAAGLCGVQGALIVQPQGSTDANSFRGTVNLPLIAGSSTVRVAGPSGDCVDVPGNLFAGDLLVVRQGHGSLVGQIQPPLSSGRCAGPTAQDLAGLTLPVRRSGGKRPSYDLRFSESFTAGPFTGELVSTLVLRPASVGGFSTSSGSSSGAIPVTTPVKRVLVEQVKLRYRIASLPGTLDTTFSGEPDPFCAALDSCGASGNVAVGIGPFGGTVVVIASRVVGHRVDARQAIADLRRGRLFVQGAELKPFRPPFVSTTTSETFLAADGSRCQAASTSRQALLFFGPGPGPTRPRNALAATVIEQIPEDLMRTNCPGPADTDVFGQQQAVVAQGSVGPAQLLRRQTVLSLSHPGSFAGIGYVGTRGGALQFSLSLESVRGGTVEQPAPGVPPVPPPGVVP